MYRIATVLLTVFSALVLLAACGGNGASADSGLNPTPTDNLIPLFESSLNGVSALQSTDEMILSFASVPQSGIFLRIPTEPGTGIGSAPVSSDNSVLNLAVATDGGIELGLAPLSGYSGGPVRISIPIAPLKQASVPPVGNGNLITDLRITDEGGGSVLLEWTQFNLGDYDLNGEVNLSDITPIALSFGMTYDPLDAAVLENPLFWVDGDGNGEINLSDLTTISVHYGCTVAGYNILHNGALLPPTPTVPASNGTPRTGLPPQYAESFAGLPADTWVVVAVDGGDVEGADSDGNPGPVELLIPPPLPEDPPPVDPPPVDPPPVDPPPVDPPPAPGTWLADIYNMLPTEGSATRAFQNQAALDTAAQILVIVNSERTSRGLAPLALDVHLERVGQAHAMDMATNDYFAHDNQHGLRPWDRLDQINPPSYTATGENIAAGQPDAATVMQKWMDSPGHQANILNSYYTYIGIGIYNDPSSTYGVYYVQMFAKFTDDPNTYSDWYTAP